MNVQDSAHVLYVDHEGHPAPLSMCYHATASRRLASAVDRHPPSTVTEVDSAYCPQCLAFHDATSAAILGFCPKASCRLCPVCRSVASLGVEGGVCMYRCGRCEWTSQQCSLVTPIAVDRNGVVSIDDLEKASEELLSQWTDKRSQRDQSSDEHFKQMLETLEGMAKEHVKGQRSTFSWMPTANARRKDGPEGWSIEALEDSLLDRKKLVSAALSETVGGQDLMFASLLVDQNLDESLQGRSIASLLLQGDGAPPMSLASLLPLPIPLRPRKSRRCRAELKEGRPGILLKPKLNPLEGDSSLRTGHSQWWKKDSSAVQVLPRVRVSIHASDETKHVFLLKVANPTLGSIRMRLAASDYAGEPVWDEPESVSCHLQNLLVDPFTDQRINAQVMPHALQSLDPTEICELQAAEDSFLELGKVADEIPEAVANWDAGQILFHSKVSPNGTAASLRLLASKNSMAWFELVVLEGNLEQGVDSAVSLSMDVEVGNGSWDSSLVRPEQMEQDKKDMVSFDLVIAWENLN